MQSDIKFTDPEVLPKEGTEIHEGPRAPIRTVVDKNDEWRHFAIGTPIKINHEIFTLRKITNRDLVFRHLPREKQ